MNWASLRKYGSSSSFWESAEGTIECKWRCVSLDCAKWFMTDYCWIPNGWISATICSCQKKGSTIGTWSTAACLRPPLLLSWWNFRIWRTNKPTNFWSFCEETFQEPKPQAVAAVHTTPFSCGNARILHVILSATSYNESRWYHCECITGFPRLVRGSGPFSEGSSWFTWPIRFF